MTERELEKVIYEHCNTYGYDMLAIHARKELAMVICRALANKIPKQEAVRSDDPACICSAICPVHDKPIHPLPEAVLPEKMEYLESCDYGDTDRLYGYMMKMVSNYNKLITYLEAKGRER
jgi:hypothetical protein